jgi:soluble lytic murein transglycosylase-like protein
MRNGIQSGVVPADWPFAKEIPAAADARGFSAILIAAIQHNETDDMPDAATIVSADGGRGVMQLTATFPPNWKDPSVNIQYAIDFFLKPAEEFWADSEQGVDLVRCIAAEYNAGRGNAIRGHDEGDVDLYTTNNYAARALETYQKLAAEA